MEKGEMKQARLIRTSTSREFGTFGVLIVDGHTFCFTLEPPDMLNATGKSSIPTGQYTCRPYSSPAHPNVYQIMDVYDRFHVLFHPGNFAADTKACVLLGNSVGKLKVKEAEQRAILNSGKTFNRFREVIGNNDFHLTIIECY